MPLIVVLIIRFVQLIAVLAVWAGSTNVPWLVDYLQSIANGQPWEQGEMAKRTLCVTGPIVAGAWAAVGLQYLLQHGRMLHARSLRYPDEPWMWRPEWAERRIRLSNRTAVIVCAVAFALYFAIVVPAGFWMASIKLATGIYWFVGIFGAILLAFARQRWLNRRWGRSELSISTLPGVIGGPFAGIFTIGEAFPDGTPFRVTLRCVEHRVSRVRRRSKHSHTNETILWQSQKVLSRSLAADRPGATALPCYFAIPYDYPPTSSLSNSGGNGVDFGRGRRVTIRWELSVRPKEEADVRQATFEVPVFKTAQSSPNYREDETIDRPFLEPVDAEALLARHPYRLDVTAAGERHTFSTFHLGMFCGVLAFTLAVAAGTWAIFTYVDWPVSGFAALIPVALAVAGVIALVEMLSWQATIVISAEGVVIAAGHFWSRPAIEYPPGAAVPLDCVEELRRDAVSAWCVRLVPEGAMPRRLVCRLDGKQEAVAVRNWLTRKMTSK